MAGIYQVHIYEKKFFLSWWLYIIKQRIVDFLGPETLHRGYFLLQPQLVRIQYHLTVQTSISSAFQPSSGLIKQDAYQQGSLLHLRRQRCCVTSI